MRGSNDISGLMAGKAVMVMLLSATSYLQATAKEAITPFPLEVSLVENDPTRIEIFDLEDPHALGKYPNLGEGCFKKEGSFEGEAIAVQTAKSWEMCQRECEYHPQCLKWTLALEMPNYNCYLYETTTNFVVDKNSIAGEKRCRIPYSCAMSKVEAPGHGLDLVKATSWKDCRKKCLQHPECSLFTYNIEDHRCWRKKRSCWSDSPGVRFNAKNITGPVDCTPNWCYMHGVEYEATADNTLKKESGVDSALECHAKCNDGAGCSHWVYKSDKTCTLFKTEPKMKFHQVHAVSGWKNCGDLDLDLLVGKNFQVIPLVKPSVGGTSEQCSRACFADLRCVYWTFNKQYKTCWIYSSEVAKNGRGTCTSTCVSNVVIPGLTPRVL